MACGFQRKGNKLLISAHLGNVTKKPLNAPPEISEPIHLSIYTFSSLIVDVAIPCHVYASVDPRFGRALARLRSRHQAQVQQAAASFLQNPNTFGKQRTPRKMSADFAKWVKAADLNPVFEYLTA